MTRRIYIAGPMRGYPEHNVPAFNRAAERFRALVWQVSNPADISEIVNAAAVDAGHATPLAGGEYLRADVQAIAYVDAIALLPGWERSTGARCEVALAITMGLAFYDAGTGIRREPPERVTICGGYEREPGFVDTFDELVTEIRDWQAATFPAATPSSIAKHLLKEAKELDARPDDEEEMADIFMLLVGASRGRDLLAIARAKLEVNKGRAWGEPDADGVVEHVAEGAR